MSKQRRELEKRAQTAILKSIITNYRKQRDDWLKEPPIRKAIALHSFFKPANAIMIGSIIVLSGCLGFLILPFLPFFGLVGGVTVAAFIGMFTLVFAELFFLYVNFKNKDLHAEAVAGLFEPQVDFEPKTIHNKELNDKVDEALEYWSLIADAVETVPKGVLYDRLEDTNAEVTHWLQAVYHLAERVDKFRLNKVVKRDLASVPKAIDDYKKKLAEEDDPGVRRQLDKTIADKERQLQTLINLENNMDKAVYQLDSTISSLGTIYSQLMLVGSKDDSGSKISRLQAEISEEVNRLEDLSEAMDEVYEESSY